MVMWGDWEGVKTFRRCDTKCERSLKGMSGDGDVSWSWGRCNCACGGVTVVRKCDSYQGGVKGMSVDGEV